MICVSVGEKDYKKALEISSNYSFAEIRIDQLENTEKRVLKRVFTQHSNLIATCRKTGKRFTDIQRLDILRTAAEYGAAWIDADIENSESFIHAAVEICRRSRIKLIISFHDYKITPDYNTLVSVVEKASSYGADIIKIACSVNDISGLERLLSIPSVFPDKKISIAGMGRLGERVRILSLSAGSVFTYASSAEGSPTASGQIDYSTLSEIQGRLKDAW